ncbi:MAG: hypothetical protein KatS3mg105_0067 [Gemmatales bacterium]|nr:MAG: hypothetical protein KatS3mg105_0067 [Gemmatales bacterium]
MPDPGKLLNTLHQAVRLFRTTPGRQGRFLELQDVDEVLVAGDLHGNLPNFRQLLARADLARQPRRHLVLQELIHGPFQYSDGGDKSHQLLDLLAALKCQFPHQVHMLLGNHEQAQLQGRAISKNDQVYNDLFRRGIDSAYGIHGDAVYRAYMEMFEVLPLAIRTPNRIFLSHSLPKVSRLRNFTLKMLFRELHPPQDWEPGGPLYELLWGRDVTADNATRFLELVDADFLITGHIACPSGYEAPNPKQLILDCMSSPAAYCLFAATRPLTQVEIVGGIKTL